MFASIVEQRYIIVSVGELFCTVFVLFVSYHISYVIVGAFLLIQLHTYGFIETTLE